MLSYFDSPQIAHYAQLAINSLNKYKVIKRRLNEHDNGIMPLKEYETFYHLIDHLFYVKFDAIITMYHVFEGSYRDMDALIDKDINYVIDELQRIVDENKDK